ncbi:NADP-dependent oxidoreductase [Nocardia transvalensis]|uniref:NADP-dependent oxidoreductase n=1 Tax=Nocardia transvalensis TaxID=37333 RepID=UPI00189442D0|nr:NADP-dependent oxidoreductase [Nocardia transvalensis]MBF6331232.1 NADP-dependent oxidoreductase [Nocardia transvalensis]
MKAVVFEEYGPPEVLRIVDLATPNPEPGQVRVRVHASGVQPFDTGVRQGWPGFPVTFPAQIGNEFAGVVDAVGPDVTEFVPGDEVLGWVFMAGLAEYVVVGTDAVVPKPQTMPWEVAGSLSASGQTAYTALHELGVGQGDTVLVHAAAGGVGTVAVQLARAWGATVLGTASPANHSYLQELGAMPVAYGEGLIERVRQIAPQGVDAVVDGAGGRALRDSIELVENADRIGTLVDHALAEQLGARSIRAQRSASRLAELVRLWERGSLRVHVRATYPLDRAAEAHRDVERGHGRGKVAVVVRD